MDDLLSLAQEASQKASILLRDRSSLTFSTKSHLTDYVTNLDKASEELIRSILSKSGIEVLGEEMGGPEKLVNCWVVDPIDGTHNYLTGSPLFGINISLFIEGEVVIGHTFLPELKESYSSIKGEGVYFNSMKLPLMEQSEIEKPFILSPGDDLASKFPSTRSIGAASVELSWLSRGLFSGVSYKKVAPWDVAQGILFINELGGSVKTHNEGDNPFTDSLIIGRSDVLSTIGW